MEGWGRNDSSGEEITKRVNREKNIKKEQQTYASQKLFIS